MKRKGFTLVELLAVIVVLAVIALIAVPTILGVIEKAKRESAKSSVYGYIDAMEKSVAIGILDEEKGIILPENKILETGSNDELIKKLLIKGQEAKYLSVQFNKNSEVESGSFCIDKYSFDYEYREGVTNSQNDYCSNISIALLSEVTTSSIKVTVTTNIENIEKYEFKINDGDWNEVTDNTYTFENLKDGDQYNVSVKIMANDTYEYSKNITTKELEKPEIKSLNSSLTGYTNEEKVSVEIVEDASNYIKTTTVGTINIPVTESCGTGVTPTECVSISETTTLEINTWYKINSDVEVLYDQEISTNEVLYAISYDLTNYSLESSISLLKIDKTNPEITFESSDATHSSATIKYIVNDNMSGVEKYSCSYGLEEGTYDKESKTVSDKECVISDLNPDTTYYFEICATDKVGNRSCYQGNVTTNNGLVYLEEPIEVYFVPESGENCSADEAVSTKGTVSGCMKWYAYSYNAVTNEYNLILDHNIAKGITWLDRSLDASNGPITLLSKLNELTSNWEGVPSRTDTYIYSNSDISYTIDYKGYKARLITGKEICGIIYKGECEPSQYGLSLSSEPWLYENRDSANYWTADLKGKTNPWYVSSYLENSSSVYCWSMTGYAVRPVITLPKSKVEIS